MRPNNEASSQKVIFTNNFFFQTLPMLHLIYLSKPPIRNQNSIDFDKIHILKIY